MKKAYKKKNNPLLKFLFTLISLFFLIVVISVIAFRLKTAAKKQLFVKSTGATEQITVFTHGSFGSVIGLINFFQVIKDDISGTTYKKTVSKMRNDPGFYSSQPIMQKGLVSINPSFDLNSISNARYAAYPLIKGYDQIEQSLNQNRINNHYYTFGWSGLLSQSRRRKEAIRFYNALSEEIDRYKLLGKNVQIKILTHSHGGNLALNLAAVHAVMNNFENIDLLINNAINEDQKEAYKLMYEQIKILPKKSSLTILKGQKFLDYFPEKKDFKVSELLMFGCPIQPETEPLVLNNFFGHIYNIYSEEDVVQDMDVFSTKKESKKRLKILKKIDISKLRNKPEITQIKIMIERDIRKNKLESQKIFSLAQTETTTNNSNHNDGFIKKLLSNKVLFSKKTMDPSHKEMWFVSWEKSKNKDANALEIIPCVTFMPLILNAVKSMSKFTNDIDINLRLTARNLKVYAFKHKEKIKMTTNKMTVPRNLIDSIKTKLLEWRPEDISVTKQFDTIKNYQAQN